MKWVVALKIISGLLPLILKLIQDEEKKQTGDDQLVDAIIKRFHDVNVRVDKARADACSDNAAGMRNNQFKRD